MSPSPAETLSLLSTACVLFNALRMLSYVPQIMAVYRDRTGARAISVLAWTSWLLANLSTGLYATFVATDLLLAGSGYFNATANAIVIGLTLHKRGRQQHGGAAIGVASPA